MLDANDNMQDSDSQLQKLVYNTGLTDVTYQHHGLPPDDFRSYNRGSAQIDYMLASPELLPYIPYSGFLAFRNSDHRLGYLDVELDRYFKETIPDMGENARRGISATNSQQSEQFMHDVDNYLENSIIDQLLLTPATPNILNQIDTILTSALKTAEKKNKRKLETAWSPALRTARKTLEFAELWITELTTNTSLDEARQRLVTDFNVLYRYPNTVIDARQQRTEAVANLREATAKAAELRAAHMQTRIEHWAELKDKESEKVVTQMAAAEKLQRAYRKIKRARQPSNHGGIKYILVPDGPDKWKRIIDSSEINSRLQERNCKHYQQANGTPYTIEPLTSMLGQHATSDIAQDILDGIPPKVNDETIARMFKNLSNRLEPHTVKVTAADLITGYSRWREDTTTSPSGRHLSLFKALILAGKGTHKVFEIMAYIINHAIKLGHILPRWKHITCLMLEKLPGKPRIDKLRIIQLFENDINLTYGILFSRRLLWHAEKQKRLGDEQWGSRTGKSAIDTALMKRITYEMIQLTRCTAGTFDNDAKACYDRIVMNLALLRAQQLGLPKEAAEHVSKFLQQARYKVKTALGLSDIEYSQTDGIQLHGPGQGSRAAPAIWVLVSTLLTECLNDTATGITFNNPTRSLQTKRNIDAFVDDTTLWANLWKKQGNINNELAAMAQTWEQLLSASGGKLELTKCFYYIMDFEYDAVGHPRLKTGLSTTPIMITDSTTGEQYEIQQVPCNTDHKTLGCGLGPTGSLITAKQLIEKKMNEFRATITNTKFTRFEARLLIRSVYTPSLSYTLETTSFKYNELNKMQKKVLGPFAAALGYNRHIPTEIRHAPISRGGIGLPDLYVIQGTHTALAMIKHLRFPDKLGTTLSIALDWFQLVAGLPVHIYDQHKWYDLRYTNSDWFNTLHQFLIESECAITTPANYKVKMRRDHDTAIMTHAHNMFKPNLNAINACRLWLKVETIADIATASGTHIQQQIINGSPPDSTCTIDWPKQEKPSPPAWTHWRKFIQHISNTGTRKLYTQLGQWHNTGGRQWSTYLSGDGLYIQRFKQQQVQYFIVTQQARTKWIGYATIDIPEVQHWLPADLISDDNNRCTVLPTKWTVTQLMDPTNEWQTDLHLHDDMHETITDEHDIVALVSDGGYSPELERGSFGFTIMSDDNQEILCDGYGTARGTPMDSFRAEGYGMLAGLTKLKDIKYKRVIIATDNLGLVKRVQKLSITANSTLAPHWDIVQAIQQQLPAVGTYSIRHVKGHQDRFKHVTELEPLEQLNVEADILATRGLTLTTPTEIIPLPNAIYLRHGKQTKYCITTSRERITLATAIPTKYHQQYIERRYPNVLKINWPAIATARAKTPAIQNFTTKLMHGWLPTNDKQHRFNNFADNKCPYCSEIETQLHLVQCQHDDRRLKYRTKLYDHLVATDTDETLLQQIIKIINETLSDEDTTKRYILYGLVPVQWTKLQEQYTGSKVTAQQWTTKLITTIWTTAHDAWTERNKTYHEQETHHLNAKIQQMYALANTINERDRAILFSSTEEALLNTHNKHKSVWLSTHKDTILLLSRKDPIQAQTNLQAPASNAQNTPNVQDQHDPTNIQARAITAHNNTAQAHNDLQAQNNLQAHNTLQAHNNINDHDNSNDKTTQAPHIETTGTEPANRPSVGSPRLLLPRAGVLE